MRTLFLLAALAASGRAAPLEYGAKGIFPVYDSGGEWLVFDKNPAQGTSALREGRPFLVVGSRGSGLFRIARSSQAAGGACRGGRPAKLRAAVLGGARDGVGSPIIAIKVPKNFKLKGSRARYVALANQVNEDSYRAWDAALKEAIVAEAGRGEFAIPADGAAPPSAADVLLKIEFASPIQVQGLDNAYILVEGAQVRSGFRRCLRLAVEKGLVGACAPLPHELMAETALLRFVAYDPSGEGRPFVLAYTSTQPLWGHERWGFVVTNRGARLFLKDAMDPRCREGF